MGTRAAVKARPASVRARVVGALIVAAITGSYTYSTLRNSGPEIMANDFTYSWLAARAVAAGTNPYDTVRSQPTPWGGGWFYPHPAALIALPLAWLPVRAAGAVFIAVSCGLLAFLVTRGGMWRLTLFLSAPVLRVCQGVQWSPLLVGGAICPNLLGIVAAKPNLGAALFAYQTSWRAVMRGLIGAGVLVALSLAVDSGWPSDWIQTLRADHSVIQYRAPILTPFGVPIALAALKWRRPEARLLFAMGCLPQNGFFYDQLPLLLIPATAAETLMLAGVSHIGNFLAMAARMPGGDVPTWSASYFPFMVASLYLPCVILVLGRANEGPLPSWIEKHVEGLPTWFRGSVSHTSTGSLC
jgi:hypothetical protein